MLTYYVCNKINEHELLWGHVIRCGIHEKCKNVLYLICKEDAIQEISERVERKCQKELQIHTSNLRGCGLNVSSEHDCKLLGVIRALNLLDQNDNDKKVSVKAINQLWFKIKTFGEPNFSKNCKMKRSL